MFSKHLILFVCFLRRLVSLYKHIYKSPLSISVHGIEIDICKFRSVKKKVDTYLIKIGKLVFLFVVPYRCSVLDYAR